MAKKNNSPPRICNAKKLMAILITGCAGFIGFHLTLEILKKKITIIGR